MTSETTGIRPYGPGKFNTILDAYVYSVSLDDGADEEESVGDGGEWYGIMRPETTLFRTNDPEFKSLNADEQELFTSSAGVILCEDSRGFVSVTYYRTQEELELDWTEIVKSFEVIE